MAELRTTKFKKRTSRTKARTLRDLPEREADEQLRELVNAVADIAKEVSAPDIPKCPTCYHAQLKPAGFTEGIYAPQRQVWRCINPDCERAGRTFVGDNQSYGNVSTYEQALLMYVTSPSPEKAREALKLLKYAVNADNSLVARFLKSKVK